LLPFHHSMMLRNKITTFSIVKWLGSIPQAGMSHSVNTKNPLLSEMTLLQSWATSVGTLWHSSSLFCLEYASHLLKHFLLLVCDNTIVTTESTCSTLKEKNDIRFSNYFLCLNVCQLHTEMWNDHYASFVASHSTEINNMSPNISWSQRKVLSIPSQHLSIDIKYSNVWIDISYQ